MAESRRPFRTRRSCIQRVRRSTHQGAKLASSSSGDGSPEHPVKVLVVGGTEAGAADESPTCVPVFGGGDEIPRSIAKIGEGDIPKMCDGIGEGGLGSISVPKMCDGIGDASASSMPIPKMCGGGREEEPVKLGTGGGDRSPERVVSIGRSRLRVDLQGQLYVLDSEDEDTGMEAGLYVPDSEEEDGHGRGCERRQFCRRAGLPGDDVGGRYNCGHAVLASTTSKMAEKMTMVANPIVQLASVPDAMDVPAGTAAATDELHPEMVNT